MGRVLKDDGPLLLSFHTGGEKIRVPEQWGVPIFMGFFLFPVVESRGLLEASAFTIEEVIEREPYAPAVEYQSRRAYIFARKRGF